MVANMAGKVGKRPFLKIRLEKLKKHTIFRLKGWKSWNFNFIFKTEKFI